MNIIILPLYGIGDVLMTTPALKVLKTHCKDCRITYLNMFRSTYEVLKNNPNIDSLIHFPFLEKSTLKSLRFALSLRGKFDCSINFFPSNRNQYNILAWLIGDKKRIGHRYLHDDMRQLNFLKNTTIVEDLRLHVVEENIKLLKLLDVKTDTIPPMQVFLTHEEESRGRQMTRPSSADIKIGIHAGSSTFKGHAHKRWPKENFAELINSLDPYSFYLFGDIEEGETNAFISDSVADKERVIIIRSASIREVAAAIKDLDLFVTNDSGLMHIAAAVGTPVVALFGPSNYVHVRPWGVPHRILSADLPCSPCTRYSPRPLVCTSKNELACQKKLNVSTVRDAVEGLLSETRNKDETL